MGIVPRLTLIVTISLNILATPVFADIHQAKAAIRVRDFALALSLLKPLAEIGDPAAQFHLGALYRCGCGLERDDKSAFDWFEKAAGKNFPRAQFNLGNMYENGWGTKLNKEKAKFWFQKAASAGHRMARAKLGNTSVAPLKPQHMLAKNHANKKPADPYAVFRWAARRGITDEVIKTLKSGIDINLKDENGRTALMDASENGHHAMARLLIKMGAKVRVTDQFHDNALLLATRFKHEKVVEILSSAGSNINSRDLNGNTPLLVAAEKGRKSMVRILLKHGANVHLKNKRGNTALAIAQTKSKLKGQHKAIAKLLLANGAKTIKTKASKAKVPLTVLAQLSPGKRDSKNAFKGWSPLMIAAWRGQTQAVSTLLANPHESLDLIDVEGYTVLSRAVHQGHLDVVKVLLNAGAKTGVYAVNGKSPLIIAVSNHHEAIVDELVNVGAKLNLPNELGQTPLMLAILKEQHKITKKLLKAGASVEVQDKSGNTALIYAAKMGAEEVLEKLLDHGADVSIHNAEGRSALWYGADAAKINIVRMLLNNEAIPNTVDTLGHAPITRAILSHQPSIVSLLINHGSNLEHQTKDSQNNLLMLASLIGSPSIAKLLIDEDAPVDNRNFQGDTALLIAVKNNFSDVVKILLTHGANPNLRNKKKENVRTLAEQNKQKEILGLLDQYAPKTKWLDQLL